MGKDHLAARRKNSTSRNKGPKLPLPLRHGVSKLGKVQKIPKIKCPKLTNREWHSIKSRYEFCQTVNAFLHFKLFQRFALDHESFFYRFRHDQFVNPWSAERECPPLPPPLTPCFAPQKLAFISSHSLYFSKRMIRKLSRRTEQTFETSRGGETWQRFVKTLVPILLSAILYP